MTAPEWAVEKAARVAALVDDYDGCFERIDEWEHTPEDERQQYPDEYPESDYEDAEWWRKRARAALDAVWPETTTEWGVRFEDGFVKSWRGNEQAARRHEREVRSQPDDPGVLVAREVGATEWQEVTR